MGGTARELAKRVYLRIRIRFSGKPSRVGRVAAAKEPVKLAKELFELVSAP
jgi:hypothetical protein